MKLKVDIEKRLGDFCLRTAFEAEEGITGLLGASGSGKSMTLKCIAGIERPDRGTIELDGVTLFDSSKGIDLPPQKRHVGYLFQNYALFPNMTVRQNILCGLHHEKDKAVRKKQLETSPSYQQPIEYTLYPEYLEVCQGEEHLEVGWELIYKIKLTGKMVAIQTGKMNAFVWPLSELGDEKASILSRVVQYTQEFRPILSGNLKEYRRSEG